MMGQLHASRAVNLRPNLVSAAGWAEICDSLRRLFKGFWRAFRKSLMVLTIVSVCLILSQFRARMILFFV